MNVVSIGNCIYNALHLVHFLNHICTYLIFTFDSYLSGVNFTNILWAAFAWADPQKCTLILALLARKMLMKLTPGNPEQGKCRLTNEYPFFLFFNQLLVMWKKYFVSKETTYSSKSENTKRTGNYTIPLSTCHRRTSVVPAKLYVDFQNTNFVVVILDSLFKTGK